jgi:uncharacterized phage protein (TIGR02218 family)
MSYQSLEESDQDSSPVLLFQFVQGSTIWRLTSIGVTINRLGYDWTPAVVIPDKFGQSSETAKDVLHIKLPVAESLAQSLLMGVEAITKLTVWRGHYDDASVLSYWKGRILDTSIDNNNVMTLECESIFSSLRRTGLAPMYSRNCRHVLFGNGCKLNRADYAQTGTVTAVTGNGDKITIAAVNGAPSLVGGTIKAPDGTIMMISSHDGAVLTLMHRLRSLVAAIEAQPGGFTIQYYTGCDKSFTTCDTKFGNRPHFGGFIGIPDLNPMGGNNIYI